MPYDCYKDTWIDNCRNKPKLRTYITFKNVFRTIYHDVYVTITTVLNCLITVIL